MSENYRTSLENSNEAPRRDAERKDQEAFGRSVGDMVSMRVKPTCGTCGSGMKSHPLLNKPQFSSENTKIAQTADSSEHAEHNAETRGIQPAPVPSPVFGNELNHSNTPSSAPTLLMG
jgi:hypothetical protein